MAVLHGVLACTDQSRSFARPRPEVALPDLRLGVQVVDSIAASAAVLVLLLARLIQTPLLLLLHMRVQLQVFFSAPVFLPFAF